MRRCLVFILCMSFALSSLMAQLSVWPEREKSDIPVIVNDSLMFIGQNVDSLTEEQRYFNPLYLIVQKGKEYLKKQLIRASVCDCDTTVPNKRIGVFSIASKKYVTFSQGNLQYLPAANLWKFANTQYETLDNSNKYISANYRNWIDLFGWSGDNTTTPFGVSTSTNNTDYAGEFVDWGSNWICGDEPDTWRTLSKKEWEFILYQRYNAAILWGIAQVEGQNGIILLPDNWNMPNGIHFKAGVHSEQTDDYSVYQSFTKEQWLIMEQAGAVFLPACGYRNNTTIEMNDMAGRYWFSTKYDADKSYGMYFYSNALQPADTYSKYRGRSVRLVANVDDVDWDTIPQTIQLSLTDTILYIGESLLLTTIPYNRIDGKINWTLSDSSLALINEASVDSCRLTVLHSGTLLLQATSVDFPDIVAECKIVVRNKRISGVFSIGGDKQVIFAPGNLQYMPSTKLWQFADAQYQYIGSANISSQSKSNGRIDLFGYSATNSTAPFGISSSTNNTDYAGDFVDWGTNTIRGDEPSTWRTMSKAEWEYVLNKRTNAKKLRSHAQIEDVNGCILLPDEWVCPDGISFIPNQLRFDQQRFTESEWAIMEQAGAIFLPAAGRRNGRELITLNEFGNYWSSTRRDTNYADYLAFCSGSLYVDAQQNVAIGRSVRLVRDTVVPEAVDLGLSVKWATFNIGAKVPEQSDFYFAWGETETKDEYSWETYKWGKKNNDLSKYCTNNYYGTIDNKVTLRLEDDIAHLTWGGEWRIPSSKEWEELYKNCTWQWMVVNGQAGYKVTSKIAGYTDKSIFIPAAGYRTGKSISSKGTLGYYLSSTLYTGDPYAAWRFTIRSTAIGYGGIEDRYCGLSVRPVLGDPTLTTPSVTSILATQVTDHSALLGGKVTYDGNADITEFGIVYSTSKTPTIANNKIIGQGGMGWYLINLTGLASSTIYYARAYAINEKGITYGSQVSFTTGIYQPTDTSGLENGHAYVDLGLPSGLLWATCNVGADMPEEYGGYFAWGEVEQKQIYNWSTYKWCKGTSSTITKYTVDSSRGTVDNKSTLDMEDDAARVNWGGSWRMPTDAEWKELQNNCIWILTTENGVNGHRVTSKKNGNSIFLPATGYKSGKTISSLDFIGYYQSRTLYVMYYGTTQASAHRTTLINNPGQSRYIGMTIRPVLGKALIAKPTMNTSSIVNVTDHSAQINGGVTLDGGSNIVEYGVVYSTSKNPTITNGLKVVSHDGIYSFTCQLAGLQTETIYYARTYATNSEQTAYGTELTFKTIPSTITPASGIENGYGYVDMGLSVKWATCNIGSEAPETYGQYFAWGEVKEKDEYSWNTYQWCNVIDTTLTKYCVSSKYGIIDDIVTLEKEDDAASVNWGGKWRMPTDEEWTELRSECDWYRITLNSINGFKVISKKNGNSIFLPAAGIKLDRTLQNAGTVGCYSSSTLYVNLSLYAHCIYFNTIVSDNYNGRYGGQVVRPVCE